MDPDNPFARSELHPSTARSEDLQATFAITESWRKGREAELAVRQEERRTKELELAILQLQLQDSAFVQSQHQHSYSHLPSHFLYACNNPFSWEDSGMFMSDSTVPDSLDAIFADIVNSVEPDLQPTVSAPVETGFFPGTATEGSYSVEPDLADILADLVAPISNASNTLSGGLSNSDVPGLCVATPGAPSESTGHSDASSAVSTPATPSGRPSGTSPSSRSRKRPVATRAVQCRKCNVQFLQLILHGTSEQLTTIDTFALDFACAACSKPPQPTSKRRIRGKVTPTPESKRTLARLCDVCKKRVGAGGVHAATDPSISWTEPPFAVECICQNCHVKYALCSECGGGGRFRTGKWRPHQLFEPKYATCSLPHYRFASLATDVTIWRVPRLHPVGSDAYPLMMERLVEAPEPLQHACHLAGNLLMLDYFAIPKYMERVESIPTWDKLVAFTKEMRSGLVPVLRGEPPIRLPSTKVDSDPRYIRSYIGVRTVTKPGIPPTDVFEDVHDPPKVITFGVFQWHVRHGTVYAIAGIGRDCRKPSGRDTVGELLSFIVEDYESMAEYARIHSTPCPPRPKWLRVSVTSIDRNLTDKEKEAELREMREMGVRPLEEVLEETGWILEDLPGGPMGPDAKTHCTVAEIDVTIAAYARYKGIDFPTSKKRGLDD